MGEIRFRYFGLHLQQDVVEADHGRYEDNRGAELLEDDRSVERLRNHDWNLATREELGLFARVGQQMRLRQYLTHAVGFEELEKTLSLDIAVARRQSVSQVLRQQQRNKLTVCRQC